MNAISTEELTLFAVGLADRELRQRVLQLAEESPEIRAKLSFLLDACGSANESDDREEFSDENLKQCLLSGEATEIQGAQLWIAQVHGDCLKQFLVRSFPQSVSARLVHDSVSDVIGTATLGIEEFDPTKMPFSNWLLNLARSMYLPQELAVLDDELRAEKEQMKKRFNERSAFMSSDTTTDSKEQRARPQGGAGTP